MDDYFRQIEGRVSKLEERLAAESVNIYKRLDRVNSQIDVLHHLATSVSQMNTELKYVNSSLNNIDGRLSEIEGKPSRRWDTIITSILSALAGGLVGIIVANLIGG